MNYAMALLTSVVGVRLSFIMMNSLPGAAEALAHFAAGLLLTGLVIVKLAWRGK